ncbi:MAG: DUF4173 domain-containing protein [Devosia nanyangense]|uniref:DUF4173 domain-containing protein n=1 Tax=Devosia nanyangense TaxID=1228055 RepID=A0A933KZV8_9HYPH|nr:DUF4173 domain-containing protein [Devosia nanyangense]
MTDLTQDSGAADQSIWNRRTLAAGAALAALIVLGDVLFWHQAGGVNVLVFLIAVIFGIVALYPNRFGDGNTVLLLVVALVGTMPLFETLSPWGLLTAQGGITLLALGISGHLPRFEDWPGAFTRFGVLAPLRLVGDGLRALSEGGRQKAGGRLLRAALVWLVPVAFAVMFAWLFATANPVIELALRAIRLDRLLDLLDPARIVLWCLIALLCWPFLAPRLLQWTALPQVQVQGPALPRTESLIFGRAAIRNSLLVFNAMFAVQTALDLIYLWGGVRLPDGMSHAEYAHRGAYPLIVTAILAGAFVLAAMRTNGPGKSSPLIRSLVYLWIAQNVWLVVSSLLRLELYVEVYYLSEMRIAAAIWMGLVGIGLVLIVVKIALDKSNKWLVTSNMVALSLTLWGVSWLDLQSLIAVYNVRHSYEMRGEGLPLDQYYTSDLGPAAIPALDEFLTSARFASLSSLTTFSLLRGELTDRVLYRDPSGGEVYLFRQSWHGWTWRGDRLNQYLLQHPFAPDTADAID